MKTKSLAFVLFAALAACSSASSETTSSNDAELSAKKPIPYVLQYVGDYESDGAGGHFDYLLMKRDGHWVGSIDGVTKTGVYYGPNAHPTTFPLKLAFVARGLSFTADIGAWAPYQPMTIHYAGTAQTLTASFANGSESICDASAGTWSDDEADPATGLFCACPAHKVYIPSLGGCVR